MKQIFTLIFISLLAANLSYAQPGNAYDYAGAPGSPGDETTGDYITLPTGVVSSLTGSYTIEAWVYWRGTNNFERIFDFGSSTSIWMFLTPKTDPGNGSKMRFAITTTGAGGAQLVDATTALSTLAWNHVAVVFQSGTSTLTLYINGTASGSGTIALQPSTLGSTNQNWLGQSQFHPSAFSDPYFNGIIDEFRISNVARYTANFTPYPVQFTTDVNTVALYHFNETSGQTVTDVTGTYNGFLGSTTAADGNDPTRITNSILPVSIIQFKAQKSNEGIELNWKASSTNDAGNFIIEKSLDGVRFRQIGIVAINPNSTSNYIFTDHSPGKSKNYYRLRIEELNGSSKYSKIVFVDMDGKNSYLAYPTATSSLLFIQVPGKTNIAIYNSLGILVKRLQLEQSQGIEVGDLSKGVYQVQFEGTKEMTRFVKM